jgi:hypothetical protein
VWDHQRWSVDGLPFHLHSCAGTWKAGLGYSVLSCSSQCTCFCGGCLVNLKSCSLFLTDPGYTQTHTQAHLCKCRKKWSENIYFCWFQTHISFLLISNNNMHNIKYWNKQKCVCVPVRHVYACILFLLSLNTNICYQDYAFFCYHNTSLHILLLLFAWRFILNSCHFHRAVIWITYHSKLELSSLGHWGPLPT